MASTKFSSQLQKLRKQKQITQEQLAVQLGVSSQAVSKWENGSYPDGDLLPKLADYFEVSIDELYGRSNGEVSLEQQIMHALKSVPGDVSESHPNMLEQMLKYCWAMQISAWQDSQNYYDRIRPEATAGVTASCLYDEAGFSLMRLNQDLEYYFLMKEPEGGFAKYFHTSKELLELFHFFGEKENLEVTLYILSLNGAEMVRSSTIAKRLGVSLEKVQNALDYLCRMESTGTFYKGSVIDEQDKEEPIYGMTKAKSTAVLMLLAAGDLLLHQPVNYQMQCGYRNTGWMKRADLDFIKQNDSKQQDTKDQKKKEKETGGENK